MGQKSKATMFDCPYIQNVMNQFALFGKMQRRFVLDRI